MQKKKLKEKIHPYTEESLKLKERYFKLIISLVESIILIPVISLVLNYINKATMPNLIAPSFVIIFILLYLTKRNNKKYNFSKWDFLDDKIMLIEDRSLNTNASDLYVTKFVLIILINAIIIVPISLTFSAIISGILTFLLGLILKQYLVLSIIKFLMIYLIFKQMFVLMNPFLINYIKDKKELDF